MTQHVTVPGKTFLLGEYAVLHQHPALLVTTIPYFELRACLKSSSLSQKALIFEHRSAVYIEVNEQRSAKNRRFMAKIGDFKQALKRVQGQPSFHAESPAGRFMGDHPAYFQYHQVLFNDPYPQGGFGASSAQFVALYALVYPRFSLNDLLSAYQYYAKPKQGFAPSGADIAAQFTGGICEFIPKSCEAIRHPWPFPDLRLGLFHTGTKQPTHEHLKSISLSQDLTDKLGKLTQAAIESFYEKDSHTFCEITLNYALTLRDAGLMASHTHKFIELLNQEDWVLAAKGCGALGGDVILVLFRSEREKKFSDWCKKRGVFFLTHQHISTQGLTYNEMASASAG